MDDKTLFKKLSDWIDRLKILEKGPFYKEIARESIEILEHIKTKTEEENK